VSGEPSERWDLAGQVQESPAGYLVEGQLAVEALRESERRFRMMAEGISEGIMIIENRRTVFANRRLCEIVGYGRDELAGMLPSQVAAEEEVERVRPLDRLFFEDELTVDELEFWVRRKDGTRCCIYVRTAPVERDGLHCGWYLIINDVTERVEREREASAIAALVKAAGEALTLAEMAHTVLAELCRLVPLEAASVSLHDPGKADLVFRTPANPLDLPHSQRVQMMVHREETGEVWAGAKRALTPAELSRLTALVDVAALSLQRMALQEQTQQRVQRLAALRSIDLTISASLDLKVTLDILLNQVVTHLRVNAAAVLLYRSGRTLEYATSHGFRQSLFGQNNLYPLYDLASLASLDRKIVHYSNLSEEWERSWRASLLGQEGFVTYIAAPLIAKGEVKGILELFHRSPLNPDSEWLEFLESLAMQAAIAIDNSELFEGLQRSNMELRLAYENTLEGWVRTLDLRDKETEDHTLRVTSLTQRLALRMGLRGLALQDIRRGALLHDIGKMALPDAILHKAGPLTEEEWVLMKRHPIYAKELLWPISYLRQAIDIPYCHHEKWDGSGYPRGLKGEAIPIAARIFAVVDVYDALSSDRPYRKAWPKEQVLEYIAGESGRQFDPAVVAAFLEMLENESEGF
jgi:PAS domain S-box-containing protein/putative nucleotidyltransferase with HDIG domain